MNNDHYTYSGPADAFAAMIHGQMIPWPRKPLSGKPKGKGGKSRPMSSGRAKGHSAIKRKMF